MSKAKDVTNYRRRRKNNLIQVCGGKCCICGYHKTNSALEFHHINPSEKEYTIAQGGNLSRFRKRFTRSSKMYFGLCKLS